MEPGHETESPPTAEETPLPAQVDGLTIPPAPAPVAPLDDTDGPTAASVLLWIMAAEGAWFPSRFAPERGIARDSLDEPLAELRLAGLVLATEWLRGVGQGYALTMAGKTVAADPEALERLKRGAPAATVAPGLAAPNPEVPTGENTPVVEVGADVPGDRDTELPLRSPVVVPALLMANAIWFFVCAVWSIRWGLTLARSLSEGHPEILHRFGAVRGMDLLHGEWWRLITSCFVHIGALHLIGNLFALAMMGPLAELLWGRWRLLVIYFVSGLAGSALAMALLPDSTLAGASGAIWGIQMSLFAWLYTFRRQLPPDLAADWFRRLTVVFLLNAAISFLPNVSWQGHLGGGVAGFVAAGLLNATRFGDRPRRLTAALLLVLLPVFCVVALMGAMGPQGTPKWQQLHQRLAAIRESENFKRERAARTEYDATVAPRLAQLFPSAGSRVDATPTEVEALLVLKDAKRSGERTARIKAKVSGLKTTAEEVAQLTTDPTGFEKLDRYRDHVHRFAVARTKSFEVLLAMFDSATPPSREEWAAWQAARLEADRLWEETKAK